MASIGKKGLGLYAGRTFLFNDIIGQYNGQTVGHYTTRASALSSYECRRRFLRGRDKMVTLRAGGGGFYLIDGEGGGPPYIHLCNDARGTLTPNCGLTDSGWLRVLNTRVTRFDPRLTIAQNGRSELRIEYGDQYWALFDALGKSIEHAIDLT